MSENCRFYVAKMAERRSLRGISRPLQSQLDELLVFVSRCEAQWR